MHSIYKATISDLEELTELFDLYRQFYSQSADLAGARKFLRERFHQSESVIFYSRTQGRTTGFVQLYPVFSSVRMKRSWLLNDLYVRTENRRQGIARVLIERCKRLAVETQAAGLLLETARSNAEGNALYPGMGFHLEDQVNYYFWENH
jgi:GNAT superfamily N-acetyltransferase